MIDLSPYPYLTDAQKSEITSTLGKIEATVPFNNMKDQLDTQVTPILALTNLQNQQQSMITEAKNQQTEDLRIKSLITQRDESLMQSRRMSAIRANYGGTLFTNQGVGLGNPSGALSIIGG